MTHIEWLNIIEIFGMDSCRVVLRSQNGPVLRTGAAYDLDPLSIHPDGSVEYESRLKTSIDLSKFMAGVHLATHEIFMLFYPAAAGDEVYNHNNKVSLRKVNLTLPILYKREDGRSPQTQTLWPLILSTQYLQHPRYIKIVMVSRLNRFRLEHMYLVQALPYESRVSLHCIERGRPPHAKANVPPWPIMTALSCRDVDPALSPLSREAAGLQSTLGSWHDHYQWSQQALIATHLQPLEQHAQYLNSQWPVPLRSAP
ncbi:hypothetical protein QNM99_11525 [Pseudomonas sp. PCH446]